MVLPLVLPPETATQHTRLLEALGTTSIARKGQTPVAARVASPEPIVRGRRGLSGLLALEGSWRSGSPPTGVKILTLHPGDPATFALSRKVTLWFKVET